MLGQHFKCVNGKVHEVKKNVNDVTDPIWYNKFVYGIIFVCLCFSILSNFHIQFFAIHLNKGIILNPLSANSTKWSNTLN